MKRTFLLLTLGALLACPCLTKADDSTNQPPPGPPPEGHHHDMSFLTDAEKAELKKAHDAAVTADPSLVTEEQALRAAHQPGVPPTQDEMTQMHAFRDKMDAAMIKADPAVAPIIEKIKAHHHGPPPPPPPAPGT